MKNRSLALGHILTKAAKTTESRHQLLGSTFQSPLKSEPRHFTILTIELYQLKVKCEYQIRMSHSTYQLATN